MASGDFRKLDRLWYLGIAVFAIMIFVVPIIMDSCNNIMDSCSNQDSGIEEQQFSQMAEKLKASQSGDMLEFASNQFAFVKKVEDDVILLRHVHSPSSRIFISDLAKQVIDIHRVGNSDRCSALERLAKSIYY
ncbi:MAG: hypothetical protein C4543_01060 [Ignavibacteriales bacterium]|nr:MAG: hypothetical protein C4543_01060 [Ignavibacteriales bacterium]